MFFYYYLFFFIRLLTLETTSTERKKQQQNNNNNDMKKRNIFEQEFGKTMLYFLKNKKKAFYKVGMKGNNQLRNL